MAAWQLYSMCLLGRCTTLSLFSGVQIRCPVRILHGAADEVVPPFVASEVVAWCESRDVHLTMIKVLKSRFVHCLPVPCAMTILALQPTGGRNLEQQARCVAARPVCCLPISTHSSNMPVAMPMHMQDGDHRLSRPEDLCAPSHSPACCSHLCSCCDICTLYHGWPPACMKVMLSYPVAGP